MDQAYFIIIAVFLCIFGSIYTYLTYRNRERLSLINSGLSPDTFKLDGKARLKSLFVLGLVFVGFSLGILGGFFLEKYLLVNFNPNAYRNYPQAYLIMVPLCVGIALVGSFYIHRKTDR